MTFDKQTNKTLNVNNINKISLGKFNSNRYSLNILTKDTNKLKFKCKNCTLSKSVRNF